MIVAGFVLIVAVANVISFNPFKQDYNYKDHSLASELLRSHDNLNTMLASKQNTVSTTVVNKDGFISKAFADNEPSVLGAVDTVDTLATEDGIEDNGITKANPDSVQKLVSRQVRIIDTDWDDTVYTVAADCGVTPKTIRESNGLDSNALKSGWKIICPPVNGVVIQVNDSNLTLPDVADKYSANLEELVSYNGFEDPQDMVDVGDYLIVPHGQLPEAPKPTPAPASTKTAKAASPSIPKAIKITGGHKFVKCQCTDYVSRKVFVPWGGNANRWIANSKAYGAVIDRKPVAGAILVTNESRYGHVMYIESVSGSKVTASEWNYKGPCILTTRTFDISDKRIQGVIHPIR